MLRSILVTQGVHEKGTFISKTPHLCDATRPLSEFYPVFRQKASVRSQLGAFLTEPVGANP